MATLYVTEFPAPFIDISRGMPMVLGPKQSPKTNRPKFPPF
jgi:hypothetical protein